MPLSKDTFRSVKPLAQRELGVGVAAGATIYAGAIVCRDATGHGVPASDTAGLVCLGLARKGHDNSGGSAGVIGELNQRYCVVDTAAIASFPLGAGSSTPMAHQKAYVFDDGSVSTSPGVNSIEAGLFYEPDDLNSGNWFVDFSRR